MRKTLLLTCFILGTIHLNAQYLLVHLKNGSVYHYKLEEIKTSQIGSTSNVIWMYNGTVHQWNSNAIDYINYGSIAGVATVADPVSDLLIFPNPSDGQKIGITFSVLNASRFQYEISDMGGKIIHKSKNIDVAPGVNAVEWIPGAVPQAGMYHCRLITADYSVTKSFVIQP